MSELIARRMASAGVTISPSRLSLLDTYFGLLTKWNKTVNLTALELDPPSEEAIDRLLVEPFLAAAVIRQQADSTDLVPLRLLDVGSGGGSPAIPLAIALTAWGSGHPVELRMVESKTRKAAFLREAVRGLNLGHAEVFNARLEDLALRPELRQTFDLVSIRAVRTDEGVWSALRWLMRRNGQVLWFRSAGDGRLEPENFQLELEGVTPLVSGSELALLRRTD